MRQLLLIIGICVMAVSVVGAQRGAKPATPLGAAGPLMRIQTDRGVVEIRLFRSDAPKSVAHIVALANRSFYLGQRIHRVERSLVQFGDPQSRDVSRRDWWGRASSGTPIGVAEINKHRHVRGTVALAHGGSPQGADSQIYILKSPMPALDGKYVVIGQVVTGMEVVDRLQVLDVIKGLTVK